MDNFKTKVIFRKYKDTKDILAVFPYDLYNNNGNITVYQHIGQHGDGDYHFCISQTTPATPSEYNDLQKELETMGYNLEIVKKRVYSQYLTAYYQI